jgi:predicted metal-binding membrane protein
MVLAMMLPTAGPMIVTYAEIADAAVRKDESIVSPLVLMAGYVAVWLGFAFTASVLQMALGRAAANPLSAGVVLFAAGLYQFSTLKQACVRHCQRPFPYLFAHWSDHTAGVFRLGLRQGLYCLGCCWAMMAVMLAVGAMNVAWMAVLGLVMGLEKTTTTMRFSRGVGAVLMTAGLAYIVLESLS